MLKGNDRNVNYRLVNLTAHDFLFVIVPETRNFDPVFDKLAADIEMFGNLARSFALKNHPF